MFIFMLYVLRLCGYRAGVTLMSVSAVIGLDINCRYIPFYSVFMCLVCIDIYILAH